MRALLLTLAATLSTTAWADTYTLPYKNQNKWVGKQDSDSLKNLLDESKTNKTKTFEVILPEENRELSIKRLKVLRDILSRSIGHGILIKEVTGEAKENTLVITPKD
ncbi:MAG: hypothetical protein OXR68_06315 [Alphaproteobacteria bacterium]|nr:hypothetical protein [Alphaproteobacteria bacterium]MDD9920219.1 hypothetical protein [Alphaproteobacteria bacterium]